MDEFMNNGNLPEEKGDAEICQPEAVQAEHTQSVPQGISDEALNEPAEAYAQEEETPAASQEIPVQPSQGGAYYAASDRNGYSQPQNNANPYSYQQPYSQQYNYNPYSQQPPVDNEKQKTNKKWRKIFCVVLAIAVIFAAVAIPVSLSGKGGSDIPAPGIAGTEETTKNEGAPSLEINKTPAKDNAFSDGALTPEQVYEKIAQINVAVMVYQNNSLYTEGTGIIMQEDKAGKYTYILTCAHVISDAGVEIVIQLEDGKRHDAQVVGYDERTDIGVLRIEATGFQCAEFGDSDALKVGSTVYAIGNPGGSALFGTFTDGKVSAIGRNITSSIGYDMVCIQHNAAISPGNSGGALVNEYGQVIGINSSKIAATEFEGISFSIPITQAKAVIDSVIAYGYVPGRPKLGISYVANDSSSISGIYGMAVQMMDLPSGSLVIYSIDPESSLASTEVQPGDMITAVNGKELDTADVLLEKIEQSKVGDVLELSIFRIETNGGRYSTSEFKVKVALIEETNKKEAETTTRGVYGNEGGYGFDFGFGF